MAVIPEVPQVRADIVVDGRPLPEYLDEDNSESTTPTSITKYVECMAGSRFAIRTNVASLGRRHLGDANAVDVTYYVDGQEVSGVVLQPPWQPGHAVYAHHAARYKENGTWKERDFMFTDLVTTEDGAYAKPRSELSDLGTITIKLYRSRASETRFHDYGVSPQVNAGHENIHEKHLKGQAISTQAKLGEARSLGQIMTTLSQRLGDAFATFNFRYRSHKDLQILRLIPRSPTPVPLEDRPQESLNREELLELLRRQKVREEKPIVVKQERERERVEDESDDELTEISYRPPTKKLKISANASTVIETIDLTGD